MTTVHSFTSDQKILDSIHSDLRRARTASSSMIPTSTGAAKAVGLVLPELNGKLDGTAIRIPTPNVSMIDFTFQSQNKLSVNDLNQAIHEASLNSFNNIISYNVEPLVSIDFNHNPASSIFDATQTQVVGDSFGRVLSWYDNEWGFSNRMIDVCNRLGSFFMKLKTLDNLELKGKKVLLRCDLNVPFDFARKSFRQYKDRETQINN